MLKCCINFILYEIEMNYIKEEMIRTIDKKIMNLSKDDSNKLATLKKNILCEQKKIDKSVIIFGLLMTPYTIILNFSFNFAMLLFFSSLMFLIIPLKSELIIKKTRLEFFDFLKIDFFKEYEKIIIKYSEQDKEVEDIEKVLFIKRELKKIKLMKASKYSLRKEKLKYIDFIENTTARKIDLKLIKRD